MDTIAEKVGELEAVVRELEEWTGELGELFFSLLAILIFGLGEDGGGDGEEEKCGVEGALANRCSCWMDGYRGQSPSCNEYFLPEMR